MNRVCNHILKIILLHAGIRPVTFSLVCKRWRQLVRGLTFEEKWSYQLQKAREAKVFLADKFSFENILGLECPTNLLLLYFAHKLTRKDDKTYTYGDFTVTFTGNYDVIVDGPNFTYFNASKRFKSLMHYKNFDGGTFVYDLTCFGGQYQWTGDVMIAQTSPTYINAMIPNGRGFATINGRTFEVYASYGVLHWDYPSSNIVYPDMTANLNL